MRALFLFFILIILIPLATAPYGGETFKIAKIDQCKYMSVKVKGSIDIDHGEYDIKGCYEIRPNQWVCHCHDNFRLLMETLPNTINNYTIVAKSYYPVKDKDKDGIADEDDKCPKSDTKNVDSDGCSASQICSQVKISSSRRYKYSTMLRCYSTDWKDNERRYFPGDCTVSKNKCVAAKHAN